MLATPVVAAVEPDLPAAPPAANESVRVEAPAPSGLHPFDMKQCIGDSNDCQLATCVRELTANGTLTLCQAHDINFP
jgi:hypothetical protein